MAVATALAVLGLAFAQDDTIADPAARPQTIPAFRQANNVAVITVRGGIDRITLRSLERRIALATRDGADAIVLDIDTPGGRLDATLDICNLLKDKSATPPNIVAWINPQAYSAGTIIALACREIVVSPVATFGDAAPIHGMPVVGLIQMEATERAKIEAPILAEVVDSARRNHYDENLVQAFVSVGIELWMIEHVDTGERIFVDRLEYRTVMGEDPPAQITSVTPSVPAGATLPRVRPRFDTVIPRPTPDQDTALTPEQIREQIEFQQQLPPARTPLSEADRGSWRPVVQVITPDRLLTVKSAEAKYFGLAVTTIANDAELQAFFGATSVDRYNQQWSESLVRVLVSLPVRIVLIVIFLLGLFLELAAPGLGVFGAVAAGALLVLIGAPYLAGMAQWWDILLIAAGIVLVAMEIFVIPGFGVAGVAGAACLLVGLVGTFVSGDLSTPEGQDELGTGIVSIVTALFAAGVGMWLLSRHVHSFPLINRLMLKTEVGGAAGDAPPPVGILEAMGPARDALDVGAEGIAATDLRPAGRGEFDGRMVDVQSPGRYIDRGSRIRVISVGRYVIEVEEIAS
jgi:membrane-bound serine protease (ClpP class)